MYILWTTGSGIVLLGLLMYFALKLRRTFDAFGIKSELMVIFYLLMMSWTTVSVSTIYLDEFNEQVCDIARGAILFKQTVLLHIGVCRAKDDSPRVFSPSILSHYRQASRPQFQASEN